MFFTYQEISWLVHMINLSLGFEERRDCLRHLILKANHNEKVLKEALTLIADNLIDSPIVKKVEALLLVAGVFEKKRFVKKSLKLLKLLDEYVDYAKNNTLSENIINIDKNGIGFNSFAKTTYV